MSQVTPDFMQLLSPNDVDFSCFKKNYSLIYPDNGTNITSLNNGSTIVFRHNNEQNFYLLSDEQTGFFIRTAFITKFNNANARGANITFCNDFIGHLFSNIRFRLGDKELESIDYPGIVTETINHLKDSDYRFKNGESQGTIPDSSSGTNLAPVTVTNAAVAAGGAVAANFSTVGNNENFNAGFLRRLLKYRHERADNDSICYNEVFIPLKALFGCVGRKLLKTIGFEIRMTRRPDADYADLFYGQTNTGVIFAPRDNNAITNCGLVDISLRVVDYLPSPERVMDLNKIYSTMPIPWYYKKRLCQKTGESGTNNHTITYAQTGFETPLMILCVVKGTEGGANQYGSVTANFSLCRHANIQDVIVDLDGQRFPDLPQNANFLENTYSNFYESLKHCCYLLHGTECSISSTEFRDLYSIFAVDTSVKNMKALNSTSILKVTIKRRGIPANNDSSINPANCDYYLVMLVEKEVSVNCLTKTVIE